MKLFEHKNAFWCFQLCFLNLKIPRNLSLHYLGKRLGTGVFYFRRVLPSVCSTVAYSRKTSHTIKLATRPSSQTSNGKADSDADASASGSSSLRVRPSLKERRAAADDRAAGPQLSARPRRPPKMAAERPHGEAAPRFLYPYPTERSLPGDRHPSSVIRSLSYLSERFLYAFMCIFTFT